MGTKLTIVMYQYVRDLEHSLFPQIKALPLDHFKEQIEYFAKYYTFVEVDDLIASFQGNSRCSLTSKCRFSESRWR